MSLTHKVTRGKIRQIIKEELGEVLNEAAGHTRESGTSSATSVLNETDENSYYAMEEAFVNTIWTAMDQGWSIEEIEGFFQDAIRHVKSVRAPHGRFPFDG